MARHPDYVLRNNAKRGAMTTWCPTCNRKSALGASLAGTRTCRYCGAVWKDTDRIPLKKQKIEQERTAEIAKRIANMEPSQ